MVSFNALFKYLPHCFQARVWHSWQNSNNQFARKQEGVSGTVLTLNSVEMVLKLSLFNSLYLVRFYYSSSIFLFIFRSVFSSSCLLCLMPLTCYERPQSGLNLHMLPWSSCPPLHHCFPTHTATFTPTHTPSSVAPNARKRRMKMMTGGEDDMCTTTNITSIAPPTSLQLPLLPR